MENPEEINVRSMVNGGKTYYSISEVCSQTGLEPYVLRYWESEFSQLRPKKNRAGNRAYREKDIDIIKNIKRLLYEEKFTIPGAKKKLSGSRSAESGQVKLDLAESEKGTIKDVRRELKGILELLTG
jgi:DNA-binding transcriptional MerR regulator